MISGNLESSAIESACILLLCHFPWCLIMRSFTPWNVHVYIPFKETVSYFYKLISTKGEKLDMTFHSTVIPLFLASVYTLYIMIFISRQISKYEGSCNKNTSRNFLINILKYLGGGSREEWHIFIFFCYWESWV